MWTIIMAFILRLIAEMIDQSEAVNRLVQSMEFKQVIYAIECSA